MEISGHKTRAVYDRYHVVSPRRLKQVAERLENFLRRKNQEPVQTDTVADKMKRISEARCVVGEPGGARTRDHRIKSAMLYQLSYRPEADFTIARQSA